MDAWVPQMVALQGSQLMGDPLGGLYHLMLEALWAVDVADAFLGRIRHHGHLWRRPLAFRSAFSDLTPERLCSANSSARPLLEAGLKLLRLIEERAAPEWLQWLGGPRGVLRCVMALNDEGTLVLSEGLGDPRLPSGRDVNQALLWVLNLGLSGVFRNFLSLGYLPIIPTCDGYQCHIYCNPQVKILKSLNIG